MNVESVELRGGHNGQDVVARNNPKQIRRPKVIGKA